MTDRQQQMEELARRFAEADGLPAPLDAKLARHVARSREILPDVLAAYDRLAAHLESAAAGEAVPAVGRELPPFALPGDDCRVVHLDDLVASGPVVVSFNRGHWCA